MNLLVIEDEHPIANQLQQLLQKEKYHCDVAYTYTEAIDLIDDRRYDLILLDWNLPDGDGLTLLSQIREDGMVTPVLMLSANSEIDDRVSVLDAGGDDYLCKPYSHIELLARIRALLRRESTQKSTLLRYNDLILDTNSREVRVNDSPINLSLSEFDLLEILLQNKNIVLTRYQLNEHLSQDYNSLKQSNLVDVHIKNLRKKINIEGCISTVRGVGYSIKD